MTCLASAPGGALGQGATPDAKLQERLDLADRFNRRVMLIRDSLLPPKWLADGGRLVFWSEEGKDGGTWRVPHARTGVVKPLVPAAELRAWLAKQVGKPVSGPRMSPFALKRLSSGTGMHRMTLAPSGNYYVDTWSSRTQPRLRELVSTEGKTRVRLTTSDVSAVEALGYKPPEALTVAAADGVTPLHGVLYRPRDFDAGKRYPVIAYIYAGPFTTTVPWSYVGNAMSLDAASMAQLGFVVVMLDPRGGPGRSKAFQDANYGRVGQTEIPDYVTGLKQAAATRPWMDLERVGIFGHSWGGYFALRGMLTAPEFFKAGYAGAPGALEEEAIINEPYLGLPGVNPAAYQAGSNLALAGKLRGALKMMHGTSDVNATLSTTMRMAEALIREGKHFEMLIMPGQPHSPEPPLDRYYSDDVNLFFLRTLGGPK